MKQFYGLLPGLLLSVGANVVYAQRNNDVNEDSDGEEMNLSRLKRETLTLTKSASPVSISITLLEGDAVQAKLYIKSFSSISHRVFRKSLPASGEMKDKLLTAKTKSAFCTFSFLWI